MRASWWHGLQITASRQNLQQNEDVPLTNAGTGTETLFRDFKHSGQLDILPVCNMLCLKQKLFLIDLNITHFFPFPHIEH
jgi:hypothetical protein